MLRSLVTTVASQKKPRPIIYDQRGSQSVKLGFLNTSQIRIIYSCFRDPYSLWLRIPENRLLWCLCALYNWRYANSSTPDSASRKPDIISHTGRMWWNISFLCIIFHCRKRFLQN